MKTLFVNLLKGSLVIILFTGASVALYTAVDVRTVNEARANVDETQVIDYLEEYGYQVISCNHKPNTISDWTAAIIYEGHHYIANVHVSGDEIIGHEIIPN